MKFEDYMIEKSNRKNKKYMAYVDGKWVHFGDTRYEHYHDKLGEYKHLDHNDEKRRQAYRKRHGAIEGKPHEKPGTSAWFSWNVLW